MLWLHWQSFMLAELLQASGFANVPTIQHELQWIKSWIRLESGKRERSGGVHFLGSSVSPVPPHASQATFPPPKHSPHLLCTVPLPLQMSHSTILDSYVSLPVPLHSSHLTGIVPVPLHLGHFTSPSPLQALQITIENTSENIQQATKSNKASTIESCLVVRYSALSYVNARRKGLTSSSQQRRKGFHQGP